MTETDVRVVEQNSHFTHYLYDLLRLIEDGTPVTAFVEMGIHSDTAKVEKRIAEEILRMKKVRKADVRCHYKISDRIRCIKGYEENGKEFTILGFVSILEGGILYDACVIENKEFSEKPLIVATETVNENYILCSK